MPTFVSLIQFTQDGVESIDELPERDADGTALLADRGVDLQAHYYTLGQYDEVVVCEAPDAETMAAAMLDVASEGTISTETLRAFPEGEFHDVVADVGG